MRNLLIVFLLILTPLLNAQIQINPNGGITPEQAIQDVLLGAGINAFNITYNGSAANAGNVQQSVQEFDASATAFPIATGVHMTTRNAPNITDADLSSIVAGSVENGVVIEFDFIPDGSLITFNYIFASVEYTSFTCSDYNDGFGFFISGPGISGPFTDNAINIATVPGTNVPVAINTVNNGTNSDSDGNCAAADPNWQANSQYFTTSNNTIYNSTFALPNYNGSTTLLPAVVNVQCNEVYHIKLAICNVADQGFDSGVFLEAGSFQSDAVDISISAGNAFSDTLIYRNCSQGVISFERLSCDLTQELTVYLETDGSAIPGVDYVELPDSVIFESEQTNLDVFIVPLEGGENPVPETIDVTAYFITQDGDTISASGTIWIVDPPVPEFEASVTEYRCHSDSLPISALVTVNTFPDYTFTWSDGDTTWMPGVEEDTLFFVDIHENGTYYYEVTLTDGCGSTWIDTAVIIMNETIRIDSMYSVPTPCGLELGSVQAWYNTTNTTGQPIILWSGPGNDSLASSFASTAWGNLSSGWYYFNLSDAVCQISDSIFVDIEEPPVANVSVNPELGYSPLTVTFSNESENANNYYWLFPNGTDLSTSSMASQTQTYDTIPGTYTVMLVAYQDGCQDTAYASFIVLELIPDPEVSTPNTFTPNGDGVNDLWLFTKLEFVENIQLYIFNRWGNLIYEEFSPNPTWNGRDRMGNEMGEGVYFYRYEATGMNGTELEGHGFIQLHRNGN